MLNPRPVNARRGSAVVPLTALLATVLIGMVAFSVDVGYIAVARNELQNAADSAALAGAARLTGLEANVGGVAGRSYYAGDNEARREARRFAGLNSAGGVSAYLDANLGNDPAGDIVLGYCDPNSTSSPIRTDLLPYNSVQVRVYRNATHGGPLELFFGRALGTGQVDASATATATRLASPWSKLLPITMQVDDYRRLIDGATDTGESDSFSYNPDRAPLSSTNYTNRVTGSWAVPQPDGVKEWKIFPDSTAPGNFGTLNLGPLSCSTPDIQRQIANGLSQLDRDLMNVQGKLTNGRFVATDAAPVAITGDTGVSWSIEDDLNAIIGQRRTIPLYKTVTGSGSNATYSIVGFVNVVIVSTTHSPKGIFIQPVAPFTVLSSPDQNMLGKLMLTR
jgi:hypothetical protein